jgi:hypothetical protein
MTILQQGYLHEKYLPPITGPREPKPTGPSMSFQRLRSGCGHQGTDRPLDQVPVTGSFIRSYTSRMNSVLHFPNAACQIAFKDRCAPHSGTKAFGGAGSRSRPEAAIGFVNNHFALGGDHFYSSCPVKQSSRVSSPLSISRNRKSEDLPAPRWETRNQQKVSNFGKSGASIALLCLM